MSRTTKFSCGDLVDNRYHIDIRIHEGRWGEVFRATDRRNDRPVALRLFPESDDAPPFDEFAKLALTHSKLTARGLAVPIDSGEVEGIRYIVTRWAPGQTLEDLLAERGALSVAHTEKVLESLLTILEKAHEVRMSHGLLRPSKIVVDEIDSDTPLVNIVDFQVWRYYELSTGRTAFEEANLSRRIIRYTGPEVLQSHTVLPVTDVYALGLIAVEMLTGRPAFDENHRIALIARQLDADAVELPESVKVGDGLRTFLAQLLQKDPSERLPHVLAAMEDFKAHRDHFMPSAAPPPQPAAAPEPPPEAPPLSEPQKEHSEPQLPVDPDEALFGTDPSEVEPILMEEDDHGSDDFDSADFLLDNANPDDLFGDELNFGEATSDYEDAPPKRRPPNRSPAGITPSKESFGDNRNTPGSSLIEGDFDDPDLDLQLDHDGDDSGPAEELQPMLVESSRKRPAKTSTAPPTKKSTPLAPILGGLVVVALIIGAVVMLRPTDGEAESVGAESAAAEGATESAQQGATHSIRITTNPPAIRVQVQGGRSGLSPLDVEVGEDEFPLRVRARMDSENIIDRYLDAPVAEYHIDFSEQ